MVFGNSKESFDDYLALKEKSDKELSLIASILYYGGSNGYVKLTEDDSNRVIYDLRPRIYRLRDHTLETASECHIEGKSGVYYYWVEMDDTDGLIVKYSLFVSDALDSDRIAASYVLWDDFKQVPSGIKGAIMAASVCGMPNVIVHIPKALTSFILNKLEEDCYAYEMVDVANNLYKIDWSNPYRYELIKRTYSSDSIYISDETLAPMFIKNTYLVKERKPVAQINNNSDNKKFSKSDCYCMYEVSTNNYLYLQLLSQPSDWEEEVSKTSGSKYYRGLTGTGIALAYTYLESKPQDWETKFRNYEIIKNGSGTPEFASVPYAFYQSSVYTRSGNGTSIDPYRFDNVYEEPEDWQEIWDETEQQNIYYKKVIG